MISRRYDGLPPYGPGQRIGLFGGTFNPPHEGHRAASLLALRRLRLDWIWWLVSPGNPLKDNSDLPSVHRRMEAASRLAAHPRIVVTGLEVMLGSPFTCDTVAMLAARCPDLHFVFLMGADSFADFHRWKRWKTIAATMPLGIIDRPGSTLRVAQTQAASTLRPRRLDESEASLLATTAAPAYVFLHGKRSPLSSTALRASGGVPSAPTTSP
jgi:nicotinate-nucleotide adenylyltransferase